VSYINGEPLHYDAAESDAEQAASHQMALDVLYRVGCQYNVKDDDMVTLCQLANVNFNELQSYSGSPVTC